MDGKLKWDVIGTREYENGTDRGVTKVLLEPTLTTFGLTT
jgi:hypothetical protein